MTLYDNHNHSQFSFDGKKTSVEKSASAAKDKGLSGICFTDHCDFFVPPMKAAFEHLVPETFDVRAQQEEIDRVNALLQETGPSTGSGQPPFRIFKGVEIGLQHSRRDDIRNFLSGHMFDCIIASVHYLDDTDPFYGGYYEGKDWKTAYGHYLETIYGEMTWLGDFDIMGHYDYVARYLNPRDLTYPAKCVNLSPGLAGSCESEPRLIASPPNSLNLSSMSLSSTGVRPL